MTYVDYLVSLKRDLPASAQIWLGEATRGLGRIGTVRVVEDIAAHYREACEEAHADSVGETFAKRVAVESLGEPKTANRKFRKMYMTLEQESRFRRMFTFDYSARFCILFTVSLVLVVGVFLGYMETLESTGAALSEYVLRLAGLAGSTSLLSVMAFHAKRNFDRRRIRAAAIQNLIACWLGLNVVFFMSISQPITTSFFVTLPAFLLGGLMYIPIIRKLPKEISDRDMRLLQHIFLKDPEVSE